MAVSIKSLEEELCSLVKGVKAFTDSGFSSFDIDDLRDQGTLQDYPLAGVMYDGCIPLDRIQQGNTVVPVSSGSGGAANVAMQFTVVIAIQYHYGGQDDTKPKAMALLDDIRSKVMGYKGVNTRPWKFVGEKPEPAASGDGIAFYSQVWQTIVSIVGSSNNP